MFTCAFVRVSVIVCACAHACVVRYTLIVQYAAFRFLLNTPNHSFSTKEMCFNLIGLLHPTMVAAAQDEPLLADLNGALHLIKDLNVITAELRASLHEKATLQKVNWLYL